MSTEPDQSAQVVESRGLTYPLYSDPTWDVYRAYGTGHVLSGPMQAWAIVDGDGEIRWIYRSGQRGDTGLPMPRDVLAVAQTIFGSKGRVSEPVAFRVGDDVYCLAWIGKQFRVVSVDEQQGYVSIEAPTADDPRGALMDIWPDMIWMLTHELWDQIWHWPDRAGERYNDVLERFVRDHQPGELVRGYDFGNVPGDFAGKLYLNPDVSGFMTFRIDGFDMDWSRILVEPVVPLDKSGRLLDTPDDPASRWVAVGPKIPLRIGMRGYRWCLSFGEMVLNWADLMDPIPGHEAFARSPVIEVPTH